MCASSPCGYNIDGHGNMDVYFLCLLFLFFAFCSFPKTPKQVDVRTSHCSRQTTLSHMVLYMWNLPPWVAFNLSDHWHVTHSMVKPCWGVDPAGQLWAGPFEPVLNSFHSKTELNDFPAAHAYSSVSLDVFLYITFFFLRNEVIYYKKIACI